MKSYKDFLNELYYLTQISPKNKEKDTKPSPTNTNKKKDPYGEDPGDTARRIRAKNKAGRKPSN